MFEAIHGSAPRMIEEGLADYANPSSIFKATEMMLRYIGFTDKADKLAEALHICCDTDIMFDDISATSGISPVSGT